jgi:hypothetical protein
MDPEQFPHYPASLEEVAPEEMTPDEVTPKLRSCEAQVTRTSQDTICARHNLESMNSEPNQVATSSRLTLRPYSLQMISPTQLRMHSFLYEHS